LYCRTPSCQTSPNFFPLFWSSRVTIPVNDLSVYRSRARPSFAYLSTIEKNFWLNSLSNAFLVDPGCPPVCQAGCFGCCSQTEFLAAPRGPVPPLVPLP